jgi:hypothetical protein
MCDEMKEREARKKNIVFHSVGECADEKASGKERQDWDRKSCFNIFSAMKIEMEGDAVRFCRRVGEKKGQPRPLVCGLWEEKDRNKVLRNARNLESTSFRNVSVCPDLTRKQREEEADMRKEADRRNEEELTEEDKTKNLKWAAVGDRGQKFLIKTVVREQQLGRGGGGRNTRMTREVRQTELRGTVRGGRYERETRSSVKTKQREVEKEAGIEAEGAEEATDEESEEEMEMEVRGEEARKRKERSPGVEEGAPPEKR